MNSSRAQLEAAASSCEGTVWLDDTAVLCLADLGLHGLCSIPDVLEGTVMLASHMGVWKSHAHPSANSVDAVFNQANHVAREECMAHFRGIMHRHTGHSHVYIVSVAAWGGRNVAATLNATHWICVVANTQDLVVWSFDTYRNNAYTSEVALVRRRLRLCYEAFTGASYREDIGAHESLIQSGDHECGIGAVLSAYLHLHSVSITCQARPVTDRIYAKLRQVGRTCIMELLSGKNHDNVRFAFQTALQQCAGELAGAHSEFTNGGSRPPNRGSRRRKSKPTHKPEAACKQANIQQTPVCLNKRKRSATEDYPALDHMFEQIAVEAAKCKAVEAVTSLSLELDSLEEQISDCEIDLEMAKESFVDMLSQLDGIEVAREKLNRLENKKTQLLEHLELAKSEAKQLRTQSALGTESGMAALRAVEAARQLREMPSLVGSSLGDGDLSGEAGSTPQDRERSVGGAENGASKPTPKPADLDWDVVPALDAGSKHPGRQVERCVEDLAAQFDEKARTMVKGGACDGGRLTCAFAGCTWSGSSILEHISEHASQIDELRASHCVPCRYSNEELYSEALASAARSTYPCVGPHLDRHCHERFNASMSDSKVRAGVCFCCARVLVAKLSNEEGKVICGELDWVQGWEDGRCLHAYAQTSHDCVIAGSWVLTRIWRNSCLELTRTKNATAERYKEPRWSRGHGNCHTPTRPCESCAAQKIWLAMALNCSTEVARCQFVMSA